ncbi:hypothetical protein [Undibacterium terreum]|uniref:Lipoprotein n=1 Tax=Undibacterium terreum TaxID=1224302 RepID=A0A916UY44_9BURK|nr:hypothetical protein [Undibacterium terreum]GGC93436.1 hypothetical protein GCM10011396_45890 [Undibacterium terreum]
MKNLISCLMVSSLLLLSGCVSIVKSEKVGENSKESKEAKEAKGAQGAQAAKGAKGAKGLHYFLPQPVIQMTPKIDGSMEVEVVYWPDTNNEYVVTAESYLGKYTLDLNIDKSGFLGSVSLEADSSGIAKQALDSATELRVAKMNATKERAKTEAADAKAKEEKQASAIAAADAAVKKAQLDLAIAQSKLDLLMDTKGAPTPPTDINAQILVAQIDLASKQVSLNHAISDKSQIASSNGVASKGDNANAPGDDQVEKTKSAPTAPEPSFFLVRMNAKSVSLEPAFTQSYRETWTPPLPPKKADPELIIKVISPVARLKGGRGPVSVVTANQPLRDVTFDSFTLPTKAPPPMIAVQSDGLTVNIHMSDKTPRGDYSLKLNFTTTAKFDEVEAFNAKADGKGVTKMKLTPALRTVTVRVE